MNTVSLDPEMKDLQVGDRQRAGRIVSLEREMRFTEAYRRHESAHPFAREAACLRVHVQSILQPMERGDWFAGRVGTVAIGMNPEQGGLTQAAYYVEHELLEEHLADPLVDESIKAQIRELVRFWAPRETYPHCRAAFPLEVREGLRSDDYYAGREMAYPMYGLGGPCLDFDKLVRLGIPGLRAELDKHMSRADRSDKDTQEMYRGMLVALDILSDALHSYAAQARELGNAEPGEACRRRLDRIARGLEALAQSAPASYHEAIQLVWLYALVAQVKNYGRLDVTLGDFLVRDLDRGVLSYGEARDMTAGLWRLMAARGNNFNNRVIVGGTGRRNSAHADRFALLAMDVQQEEGWIIPQLSLRWHAGMAPRLWSLALDTIAGGSTFPILYNDDINVPAVAGGFGVSREEASQYVPYGCGEYVLDHSSVGSPDAALNVLKAINVTLHNGVDPFFGEAKGLALGPFESFSTFEQFQHAVETQLKHQIDLLAQCQAAIYSETARHAAFPFLSLLYDDCLERGKPILGGGVRYLNGTLESFGNNSAADSLTAIKTVVFERRLMSARTLLTALDADFEGFERERRMLVSAPKFGNDNAEADRMATCLNGMICEATRESGRKAGLDNFSVVLINNGDSVLFGKTTAASADGRRAGVPLSNGNQPSAGADTCGLTALLNSMARLDPSLHAGAVHNVKLARTTMTGKRTEVDALLKGYFAVGGTQVMISVVDREALEDALVHPESYTNLIVRVGGYSERFVNLPKAIQLEVIRRMIY